MVLQIKYYAAIFSLLFLTSCALALPIVAYEETKKGVFPDQYKFQKQFSACTDHQKIESMAKSQKPKVMDADSILQNKSYTQSLSQLDWIIEARKNNGANAYDKSALPQPSPKKQQQCRTAKTCVAPSPGFSCPKWVPFSNQQIEDCLYDLTLEEERKISKRERMALSRRNTYRRNELFTLAQLEKRRKDLQSLIDYAQYKESIKHHVINQCLIQKGYSQSEINDRVENWMDFTEFP